MLLYTELLHLLILLMATQIYDRHAAQNTLCFNIEVRELADLAGLIMPRLLINAALDRVSSKFQTTGGFLSYLLGPTKPPQQRHDTGDLSMFLLLLLSHQEWKKALNPFREALKVLGDAPTDSSPSNSSNNSLTVPFEQVYELLCQ